MYVRRPRKTYRAEGRPDPVPVSTRERVPMPELLVGYDRTRIATAKQWAVGDEYGWFR